MRVVVGIGRRSKQKYIQVYRYIYIYNIPIRSQPNEEVCDINDESIQTGPETESRRRRLLPHGADIPAIDVTTQWKLGVNLAGGRASVSLMVQLM